VPPLAQDGAHVTVTVPAAWIDAWDISSVKSAVITVLVGTLRVGPGSVVIGTVETTLGLVMSSGVTGGVLISVPNPVPNPVPNQCPVWLSLPHPVIINILRINSIKAIQTCEDLYLFI
jgi:hypothetical protein